MQYQGIKSVVLNYFADLEEATPESVRSVLQKYTGEDYLWRGVYPFREQVGATAVAQNFWAPLKNAIKKMQRRQDIFIAGANEIAVAQTNIEALTENAETARQKPGKELWVMSMGNFMGLFDAPWLGIPPTGKIVNLRYAEFNCVKDHIISQSGLFVDIIGLMVQAGVNPLPPSTGVYYNYPGPREHDGLLFADAEAEEGRRTSVLVNEMVKDLDRLNKSGTMGCPTEYLERTWAQDMIWYGPAGIGASYTIPRYQTQHQLPFRNNLKDKKFLGHKCRIAEGKFACFFGWPNLSNVPLGGWLGLPGGSGTTEMQVVDVYCRRQDKLAENWVFIDIPYWLKQQGLDILQRNESIFRPDFLDKEK